MDNPTLIIVSLKYSPVHNALCRGLGEPLRALGVRIKYLLPSSSAWTVPTFQLENVVFLGNSQNVQTVLWDSLAIATFRRRRVSQLFRKLQPTLIVFQSSHPANAVVASLARTTAPGVKIWQLLHEPHVHDKGKHGWKRVLLIAGQEWGTRRLLPHLDGVLVPSEQALIQMRHAYPDFPGRVLKVPLLFEDRRTGDNPARKFFSFIGHAVPAKGIDAFFEMVQTAADLGKDWAFQIATSTDVAPYLRGLSGSARSRLRVVSKARLRDDEIDDAIRQSWAVLAPYRWVTQSGVLPVAFMHGTPVISTAIGAMPESVIPGQTGYLVNPGCRFSEWEEKFHLIQINFPTLSAHCREFFQDHFDARRGPEFLRPMLDSILESATTKESMSS